MKEEFYITNIDGIYILIFSLLIGIEIIKNVPAILHTPLMSGANAISGIILIGGIIQILSLENTDYFNMICSSLAILLATINVAGGFFVTHRMLSMFAPKNK
ncbi:MAG: NAD(P) transhydrogenase subunit alpha [Flavobacteriales bacterium]|nr:NAD(P) transhydrogenase subunit alpha [Flavobacteriales bacterium]MCB9335954.1 NAD(P) transhydrogenase subunit alpha [Flavobacteriales bacterium]